MLNSGPILRLPLSCVVFVDLVFASGSGAVHETELYASLVIVSTQTNALLCPKKCM